MLRQRPLRAIVPSTVLAGAVGRVAGWSILGVVALTLSGGLASSPTQAAGDGKRYQQSPQVAARYPALNVALPATPGLAPGRTTFTTQAELEQFIDALAAAPEAGAHITRLTLGTTPQGRALPALLISKEGAQTAAALAQLGRPVVWLIGQQHGDEPAGGEALLALASALGHGELTPLLDAISVVVIPRANPDGAAVGMRESAAAQDLNRDHALISQPETRLMHALVRQVPPAVVIDAHEFTVGPDWAEKLGGLQAVDLMVLSSTHPMTPEPIRHMAESVFRPALEAAIAPHRLSSFVYHTLSSRSGDRTISIGGNAAGIARNAFGLMGAVSFLLETRGVGIGRDSYQRRVATHYVAIKALLQTAAASADALAATVAAARAVESASSAGVVIAHTVAKTLALLPLIDPISGVDKSATIVMLDTRVVTGTERRARPAGYIIPADRIGLIVTQLELLGARPCTLRRAMQTRVERYEILSHADVDRRAINPEQSLRVRLYADRATFPAGSVYIPLDTSAATRLQLALEPDTPGSLSAQTLVDPNGAMAVMRVPRDSPRPVFPADCR